MAHAKQLSDLRDILDQYILYRAVSPRYAASMRRRLRQYSAWLGHAASTEDLIAKKLNAWVVHLETKREPKLGPKTIKDCRCTLCTIWRYCFEEGLTDVYCRGVRRVQVPRMAVRAWTIDEIRKLLRACPDLPGTVVHTDIPRSVWFHRLIVIGYYTALRLDDLLSLKMDNIDSRGYLRVTMHKTREPVTIPVPADAIKEIEQVGPGEFILPWPGNRRDYFVWFKVLVSLAGVSPGTTQKLRATSASYAESVQFGGGTRILGHRTHDLFEKHYHDRSITGQVPPSPPPLTEGEGRPPAQSAFRVVAG